MATTDNDLQVINSMTQEMMDSLKNSEGKIPSLANQLIMTEDEDVNLSCLRTEVVYDMTSSDSNKNWGYTSGIQGDITITGKDFSKYKQLKFYGYRAGVMVFCAEIDISVPNSKATSLFGRATSCFHFISSSTSYVAGMTVELNPTLTGFTVKFTQNNVNQASNSDWCVVKIEGILKTPAMIYTGAELFGSDTVSIKDGVISSKIARATLFSGNVNTAQDIPLNDNILNYSYLQFTGYTSFNNWVTVIIDRGTFRFYCNSNQPVGFTNSSADTDRYMEVYYKDDTTLAIFTPKNMSLRFVEGIK